jgi:hypothetical protein
VNAALLRAQLIAGLAAGLVGAITIDAFLFAVQIASGGAPAQVVMGTWIFVAAVVLGPTVIANPAAPAIGAFMHVCVSVFWALGYVYLIRSQPQLLTRPWISGAGFGLVVYVFMQIVLITAQQYHRPSPSTLAISLIAHIAFFGIPVALVASRMLRRSAPVPV